MKKLRYCLLLNFVLLAIWLVASKTNKEKRLLELPMQVTEDVPEEMLQEVKAAFELFPAEVTEAFIEHGWTLVLLTEQREDFEQVGLDSSVTGAINYAEKVLTVSGSPKYDGGVKRLTVHEISHFVDWLLSWESVSEEFALVYCLCREHKEFPYDTSTKEELFADTLSAYILEPEHLYNLYPELYEYFRLLFVKKGWKHETN
ncbi:MAG: hypothetical protein J6B50_09430 [Lachnospiraceae bacterium]|nr:hypothetical protein [Lachnospiraceae bacterium]MBP3593953.1 hypothetical protein [Lachnospiraceae bacterium]